MRKGRRLRVVLSAVAVWCWSAPSRAHSGGVGGGDCSGCHGDGDHVIDVSTTPSSISPGDQVTVTVRLVGSGNVGGLYVEPDAGSVDTIGGQGLAQVNNGLTHTSPKSLSGGQVEFRFNWTAPNEAGSVRFAVSSIVGNGNGASSGDGAVDGFVDFVYGCSPQMYWRDFDGDDYGRETHPRIDCAGGPPQGYGVTGDDCDDNRDTVYPGATEYCNLRDDNCNGEIDEDALPVEQFPDGDGDGYYGLAELESGETFLGCVPTENWAAEPGDCAPLDPAIHPGAEETCNLYDDNCDGKVDEDVRPRCGEGWCRREAVTCDEASCMPGEPREFEECNLLDDDCDGTVDEDAQCDPGLVCLAGECKPDPGGDEPDTGTDGGDDGGTDVGTSGPGAATEGATATDGPGAADGGGSKGCAISRGADAPTWAWLWLLGLNGVLIRRRR